MGANIGTSVTNTIVSMAHSGDRLELERAFSGATVHDMFNMLTVVTLLPLEIIIGAMSREGGLLYWISRGLTEAAFGEPETDLTFPSPTKEIVSPLVKAVLSKDKNVVKALSFGAPPSYTMPSGSGTYYCVSSAMSKAWKKVAEDAYEGLTSCSGFTNECADGSSCYTDAGDYYTNEIAGARLIGKGFLKGAGDVAGGIIGLILSLLVLCGALYVLVRLLQSLVMGQAKKVIMKGAKMNDYLAMLLGLVITIIVQSSSALTPLVGIGVLPAHKMLPMTLGANIGETCTSILAAFAVMKFNSIQIAFCHLLFNIIGILIWFPVPVMRRVIVRAACTLGFYASYWRLVPLIYILVMFVAVPGVSLGISLLYGASVAAGVVVTILALGAVGTFIFWWVRLGSCYKVVSQEERDARKAEIEEEMGVAGEKEAEAETAESTV